MILDTLINSHKVVPGQDALSFDFSGCAFARFIDDNRDINAAHISLHGVGNNNDCRDQWNKFVNYRCSGTPTIFKPTIKFDDKYFDLTNSSNIVEQICLGLISDNKQCYQISIQGYKSGNKINAMKFNYITESTPLNSRTL